MSPDSNMDSSAHPGHVTHMLTPPPENHCQRRLHTIMRKYQLLAIITNNENRKCKWMIVIIIYNKMELIVQ